MLWRSKLEDKNDDDDDDVEGGENMGVHDGRDAGDVDYYSGYGYGDDGDDDVHVHVDDDADYDRGECCWGW